MSFNDVETLSQYAYIFFTIVLTLSTIFLPLLCFTVYKKSTKEMGPLRLFLLSEIFWSYVFCLVLGLIHPTIYFPYVVAKISGPLNILCTPYGCQYVVELLFFVGVGYAQSLFLILFFRLYRISHLVVRYSFTNKMRACLMILALLIPALVYVTPVVMARVDVNKALASLISKNRSLIFLSQSQDHLVIYHSPGEDDFWITFIACMLGVSMVAIIIGGIFIMGLITYFTLQQATVMSPERYKLSIMLLKVMILQVFLAICLLVLPLCCAVAFFVAESQYSSTVVLIGGMVASTHCLVEFACIAYTVKPYRQFIYKLIHRFLNLALYRSNVRPTRPISYSISSVHSLF